MLFVRLKSALGLNSLQQESCTDMDELKLAYMDNVSVGGASAYVLEIQKL